jgi:hypothetical protein
MPEVLWHMVEIPTSSTVVCILLWSDKRTYLFPYKTSSTNFLHDVMGSINLPLGFP